LRDKVGKRRWLATFAKLYICGLFFCEKKEERKRKKKKFKATLFYMPGTFFAGVKLLEIRFLSFSFSKLKKLTASHSSSNMLAKKNK
jgi:hypothetical protein